MTWYRAMGAGNGSSVATEAWLLDGPTFNAKLKQLSSGNESATENTSDSTITAITFIKAAIPKDAVILDNHGNVGATKSGTSIKIWSPCETIHADANMSGAFRTFSKATSIDVSWIDTTDTKSFASTFYNCNSLTQLDLSNFNTANAITMISMFSMCSKLASLDVSKFNTTKVETMQTMFARCSSLTTLNLSSFSTNNVLSMLSMFESCSKLVSIDLSSFNTSNVDSMTSMFNGCSSLTSLDLSSFNVSKCNTLNYMFYNCSALTQIKTDTNWSTQAPSGATSVSMFTGCTKLAGYGLTAYNSSKVDLTYANWNSGYFYPKTTQVTEVIYQLAYSSSAYSNGTSGAGYNIYRYTYDTTGTFNSENVGAVLKVPTGNSNAGESKYNYTDAYGTLVQMANTSCIIKNTKYNWNYGNTNTYANVGEVHSNLACSNAAGSSASISITNTSLTFFIKVKLV